MNIKRMMYLSKNISVINIDDKGDDKMSRRFTLQILLPIEGYEEDKIYESGDIALTVVNLKQKPDDVYYRCLKEKSVYASFHDVVKFACEKYSLAGTDKNCLSHRLAA